jgi:hypothetical protein
MSKEPPSLPPQEVMSRGTQIPEYFLQGCLAAFKIPE